ncbi:MAG: hypothetical protein J5517_06425 [Eubacterium sp.]|nr:hypothetical protein [Eubacterium sp.]
MKYTVNNVDYFVRDDADVSVIFVKDTAQRFMLNKSGMAIFQSILDNNDTDDVLDIYTEKYPQVSNDILLQDINDIYNIMNIFDMVSEVDRGPIDSLYGIEALNEDDYKIASDFIKSNLRPDCLLPSMNGKYYTAQNIRFLIMTDKEYFYCNKSDGEIDMLVSINPNVGNINVINVVTVAFKSDLSDDYKVSLFESILEHIKKNMVKPVTKFRISILSEKNCLDQIKFLSLFKSVGFELEAELEKETEKESLFIFSKKI